MNMERFAIAKDAHDFLEKHPDKNPFKSKKIKGKVFLTKNIMLMIIVEILILKRISKVSFDGFPKSYVTIKLQNYFLKT